jgi:hypothetical protein
MKHWIIHKWKFLSPSRKVCLWCGLARYDYRDLFGNNPTFLERYFQITDYDNTGYLDENIIELANVENEQNKQRKAKEEEEKKKALSMLSRVELMV